MQQIVIFLAIEKIAIMYDFMIRGKHLYAVQCTHSGQRHTLTLIVLLSSRYLHKISGLTRIQSRL